MKMNIPVRFKNVWFWVGVGGVLLTALGIEPQMLTSWEALKQAADEGRLADMLLPPEAALGHLPMMDVPQGLEKPVINGGRLPWKRFASALKDTSAPDGTPFGLWMNGMLCAIAQRHEDLVKVRTWLGE